MVLNENLSGFAVLSLFGLIWLSVAVHRNIACCASYM
jgi:hypothetical protein